MSCCRNWLTAAAISLAFVVACERAPSEPPRGEAKSPAEMPEENAGVPLAETVREVSVSRIGAEEFERVIERYRGTVILVDHWALWCAPCVRDFPETVKLWNKYRAQGLTVISLNYDDPEADDTETRVLEFLQEQKAIFPNYLNALGNEENAFTAFGVDAETLPHYQVYGRDGEIVASFGDAAAEQEFSHEDLEAAIVEALHANN